MEAAAAVFSELRVQAVGERAARTARMAGAAQATGRAKGRDIRLINTSLKEQVESTPQYRPEAGLNQS